MRLLEEARREWRRMDRPSDLLRFESFATSGQFPAVPFKVELPHLGIDVDVGTDESMLDAMERAGVDVMSGCRRGECGLCMISVIKASGAIDHRDVFLSEGEKNKGSKMCACVSRAVGGTIVVDNGYQESHPLL